MSHPLQPTPTRQSIPAHHCIACGIEERLSPALFSNSTNAPHPPAVALSLVTSVTAPPRTPDESSNTRLDASAFSLRDLDQLLHAVIEVNPYMAPRAKLGEHWKEVARRVQESGSCLNREPDTLKNKVASLLAWVELSGKLDAVQHLKLEAKGTREEEKEREKQAQNTVKDVGETMRDAMAEARMLPISIGWDF
ncbi:hypothetical protein JB92DRAFT_2837596 [Gautieria morchelliformis]|nr:hypothetical protein JB92DRAFT_2837596 [Gautieria morchelliformis]